MRQFATGIVHERKAMATLEFAVLAAFITGAAMVIAGSIGNVTMRLFERIGTFF